MFTWFVFDPVPHNLVSEKNLSNLEQYKSVTLNSYKSATFDCYTSATLDSYKSVTLDSYKSVTLDSYKSATLDSYKSATLDSYTLNNQTYPGLQLFLTYQYTPLTLIVVGFNVS